MDKHSRLVTERRLLAESNLDEGWYDEILVEEPYYENEEAPLEKESGYLNGDAAGRMVGEGDLILLNRERDLLYVEEYKTSYGDISYGRDQLDRMDDHFDDWTVIKRLLVEP